MTGRKFIGTIINISLEIILVALMIILLFNLGEKAYDFGYSVFAQRAVDSEPGMDKVVTIIDGYTDYDIAKLLEIKGLVKDKNLFYVQFRIFNSSGKIKAGEYKLNTSMNAKELVNVLTKQQSDENESEAED